MYSSFLLSLLLLNAFLISFFSSAKKMVKSSSCCFSSGVNCGFDSKLSIITFALSTISTSSFFSASFDLMDTPRLSADTGI